MTATRPARWAVATGVAMVVAMAVAVAGCGIDAQEQAQPINPEALGGLDQTVPPSTDEPVTVAPSTVAAPASSTPSSSQPANVETVTMYYIEGPSLRPVPVEVPAGMSLRTLLEKLENGPPEAEADAGIRSALTPDLIESVRDHIADTVTINFDPALFQEIDGRDRPLLIGQIVLTLDGLGIPRVRFTLDGEPLQVLRRDGTLTTNGTEFVTAHDYEQLVAADG